MNSVELWSHTARPERDGGHPKNSRLTGFVMAIVLAVCVACVVRPRRPHATEICEGLSMDPLPLPGACLCWRLQERGVHAAVVDGPRHSCAPLYRPPLPAHTPDDAEYQRHAAACQDVHQPAPAVPPVALALGRRAAGTGAAGVGHGLQHIHLTVQVLTQAVACDLPPQSNAIA